MPRSDRPILAPITADDRVALQEIDPRKRIEHALELIEGIREPKSVGGARSLLKSALKKLL